MDAVSKRTWATMFLFESRRLDMWLRLSIFSFLQGNNRSIQRTAIEARLGITFAPIRRRNFCLRWSSPKSAPSQLLMVWIYRDESTMEPTALRDKSAMTILCRSELPRFWSELHCRRQYFHSDALWSDVLPLNCLFCRLTSTSLSVSVAFHFINRLLRRPILKQRRKRDFLRFFSNGEATIIALRCRLSTSLERTSKNPIALGFSRIHSAEVLCIQQNKYVKSKYKYSTEKTNRMRLDDRHHRRCCCRSMKTTNRIYFRVAVRLPLFCGAFADDWVMEFCRAPAMIRFGLVVDLFNVFNESEGEKRASNRPSAVHRFSYLSEWCSTFDRVVRDWSSECTVFHPLLRPLEEREERLWHRLATVLIDSPSTFKM